MRVTFIFIIHKFNLLNFWITQAFTGLEPAYVSIATNIKDAMGYSLQVNFCNL